MTMPKGWNNSNNNANTNNNNNLPLSRKQKKLLHQKASLEASLNDVRMQIQKEEERDKGPRKRKQNKLSHHKTNLEISLQDVWRQIQQEEQKHQDKYLKKHDPPSLPQLLPDEQIFWRRNLTQGWLKKKVVEVQMITSRAVRVNDGALDLQTVDRIEIANRHSRGRGKGITYSVGGRGVGPRMHFSEGESRSRHFGDMVFFSQGAVVFTVYEVEDAAGIKRLIKASNPHIK
jgi:hypothetical protein